ncbi:hypothetical protein [aff. Roholtiella sp. LEGE 12411]|uniref:hypothetical protein n=1 Tax=aff. Roholtiella sp. LEGE 12411 TaxID=1828822 RepID=UPI00187E9CFC|nr:hypothetical protein [aff. Roholtiella sp. LEGE 12411]MBE9037780.1 hypothetical protein [aff. Roholtiella sp. LEGE 12411]
MAHRAKKVLYTEETSELRSHRCGEQHWLSKYFLFLAFKKLESMSCISQPTSVFNLGVQVFPAPG